MDIMTLAGEMCGGALAKDYAVYKEQINEEKAIPKLYSSRGAIKL